MILFMTFFEEGHEPPSLEEEALWKSENHLVLEEEGGGERNATDRAALRVVDYDDSSM